jgi:hypothetical protein
MQERPSHPHHSNVTKKGGGVGARLDSAVVAVAAHTAGLRSTGLTLSPWDNACSSKALTSVEVYEGVVLCLVSFDVGHPELGAWQ